MPGYSSLWMSISSSDSNIAYNIIPDDIVGKIKENNDDEALSKFIASKNAEELIKRIKENVFIDEGDNVSYLILQNIIPAEKPSIECEIKIASYTDQNLVMYDLYNRKTLSWKINLNKLDNRDTIVFLNYTSPLDVVSPLDTFKLPLCIIAFEGNKKLSEADFDIYVMEDIEKLTIIPQSGKEINSDKESSDIIRYGLRLIKSDIDLNSLFFEILHQKLS